MASGRVYGRARSGSSSNSSSGDNIAASGSNSNNMQRSRGVMSRGSSGSGSLSDQEDRLGSESVPLAGATSNPNLLSPVSPHFQPSSPSTPYYSNHPLPPAPTSGPPRSSLYMTPQGSSSNNAVGFDSTSAAIARGEVGANYSRYSTASLANLASGSMSPGGSSQQRMSTPLGPPGMYRSSSYATAGTLNEVEEIGVHSEMEHMPLVTPGLYNNTGRPYSEYGGMPESASVGSPSFRDSTLYDSSTNGNHRDSVQYFRTKSMEDTSLLWNEKNVEADDFLHDPRTLQTAKSDSWWNFPTSTRGIVNVLGLIVLLGCFLALFLGWPIHTYLIAGHGAGWGWGLGATNSSGQVPDIPGLPNLIDADTPPEIKNGIRKGFNGKEYQLVFSDEFNRDGRSFYPGDDPFWEAVDLNYWQTRDLEWYDPDAATTKNGKLEITLSEQPIHNLNFRSGMLQSWNKLCFNGGFYVEVSISLPGDTVASGYWPGAWSMGNLGRAGYGATNDGMWPYSYASCDVGTLAGQIYQNNTPTVSFSDSGETDYRGRLSILAGQRASACTCPGEPHPGPNNKVGRGAPEIDILEAQVDWRGYGTASQSIQIAPFDYRWGWNNMSSDGMVVYNSSITHLNEWKGAATQESASAVTNIGTAPYNGAAYQSYGYELTPGSGPDSQITWAIGGQPTWTLKAGAFKPDPQTLVGQRLMSQEPMYLILNLGISPAFQTLQFNKLSFPGVMRVDYVRVWQEKGKADVSCDPESHPTANYINKYIDYYTNRDLVTWPKSLWPKNSLNGC